MSRNDPSRRARPTNGAERRLIAFAALFAIALSSAWAQTTQNKRIEWKAVEGARAYRVELRDAASKEILNRVVETTFVEVDLSPGEYKVRITVLNVFMKAASVSDWMPVSVKLTAEIDVKEISPGGLFAGAPKAELSATGSGFLKDTVAKLEGKGITFMARPVRFDKTGAVFSFDLTKAQAGAYAIVFENPGAAPFRWKSPIALPARVRPVFASVEPAVAGNDRVYGALTVRGSGLSADTVVAFRGPAGTPDIVASKVVRASDGELVVAVNFAEKAAGAYDLVLRNPGGLEAVGKAALTLRDALAGDAVPAAVAAAPQTAAPESKPAAQPAAAAKAPEKAVVESLKPPARRANKATPAAPVPAPQLPAVAATAPATARPADPTPAATQAGATAPETGTPAESVPDASAEEEATRSGSLSERAIAAAEARVARADERIEAERERAERAAARMAKPAVEDRVAPKPKTRAAAGPSAPALAEPSPAPDRAPAPEARTETAVTDPDRIGVEPVFKPIERRIGVSAGYAAGLCLSDTISNTFDTSWLGGTLAVEFPYGRVFDGVPLAEGLGFLVTADFQSYPVKEAGTKTGGQLVIAQASVQGCWTSAFKLPVNLTAHGGFGAAFSWVTIDTLLGSESDYSQDLFVTGGAGFKAAFGKLFGELGADARVFYFDGALFPSLMPYARFGIALF